MNSAVRWTSRSLGREPGANWKFPPAGLTETVGPPIQSQPRAVRDHDPRMCIGTWGRKLRQQVRANDRQAPILSRLASWPGPRNTGPICDAGPGGRSAESSVMEAASPRIETAARLQAVSLQRSLQFGN